MKGRMRERERERQRERDRERKREREKKRESITVPTLYHHLHCFELTNSVAHMMGK